MIVILVGVVAFVIVGFFYPKCNATQDRGFYSCSCKPGSAMDEDSGLCYCLDTATVSAANGCANYEANKTRYIYSLIEHDDDEEYGGWTATTGTACSS